MKIVQFAQIPGRVSKDQRHQGDRSAAQADQIDKATRAKPGEDSNGEKLRRPGSDQRRGPWQHSNGNKSRFQQKKFIELGCLGIKRPFLSWQKVLLCKIEREEKRERTKERNVEREEQEERRKESTKVLVLVLSTKY